MLVKLLKTCACPLFTAAAGTTLDVPDDMAKDLIEARAAQRVSCVRVAESVKPDPPKDPPVDEDTPAVDADPPTGGGDPLGDPPKETTPPPPEGSVYDDLKPAELRDELNERGLDVPVGSISSKGWRESAVGELESDDAANAVT